MKNVYIGKVKSTSTINSNNLTDFSGLLKSNGKSRLVKTVTIFGRDYQLHANRLMLLLLIFSWHKLQISKCTNDVTFIIVKNL